MRHLWLPTWSLPRSTRRHAVIQPTSTCGTLRYGLATLACQNGYTPFVSETTVRIIDERRRRALRDLARVGNSASSAGDVLRNATAVLERYTRDIPFSAHYSWDASSGYLQYISLQRASQRHTFFCDAR